MQIKKGDLVNGALSIIRVSGLTVNPSPEEDTLATQEADDLAAELKGDGVNVNWQYPTDYGLSDPTDTSGLIPEMAGGFKSLLAVRLLDYFGMQVTPALADRARRGLRTLEQITVSVPVSENPSTLPFGSGNEQDYRSRRFYNEPAINNDADYVFKGDLLNYTEDFSPWLINETLVSVTWKTVNSGILISNETFADTTATAQLSFNQVGGYTICITATKTNSTDVFTVQKNFIVRDCNQQGYGYLGTP